MMRRNVETSRAARVCQIASLLLVLTMVLGMLAHDIARKTDTADAVAAGGDNAARLLLSP